ncbi:MAG TPA: peptidase E [Gaiellaceae bacterium]|nr:peptidase E [Gaiellaceae bacterium]
MTGHIVAIGGGRRFEPDARFEDLLLQLARRPRPRICFVPTASAQRPERVDEFYRAFGGRDCEPTHLELFGIPDAPAAHLAAQDVVYVGGGNTANLLALWRVHGIDEALREAWSRGAVLAGWSAGANCWFEDCVTDSFGARLRPLGDGLGLLRGSFCPHYDGQPQRRVVYTRLIEDGFPAGYAADDDAALVFAGTELREVVAQREGAHGYRVSAAGEERLPARVL